MFVYYKSLAEYLATEITTHIERKKGRQKERKKDATELGYKDF